MYEALLVLHSMLRWVLLILGLVVLVLAWRGWLGEQTWEPSNQKLHVAYIATFHTQVVLGLLLYVGISPIMKPIFADMGAAMKNATLRFWAVEHITTMLLAAIITHVGHVLAKKAQRDTQKFKRAAIGFGLGFVLLLAGIPWPFREAIGRGWLSSVW